MHGAAAARRTRACPTPPTPSPNPPTPHLPPPTPPCSYYPLHDGGGVLGDDEDGGDEDGGDEDGGDEDGGDDGGVDTSRWRCNETVPGLWLDNPDLHTNQHSSNEEFCRWGVVRTVCVCVGGGGGGKGGRRVAWGWGLCGSRGC